MTEDSENPERAYGPFQDDAEPTARIAATSDDRPSAQLFVPAPRPASGATYAPGSAPLGPRPYVAAPSDTPSADPPAADTAAPRAASADGSGDGWSFHSTSTEGAETHEPPADDGRRPGPATVRRSIGLEAFSDLFATPTPDPGDRWQPAATAGGYPVATETSAGQRPDHTEPAATYLSPAAMAAISLPTDDTSHHPAPESPAGKNDADDYPYVLRAPDEEPPGADDKYPYVLRTPTMEPAASEPADDPYPFVLRAPDPEPADNVSVRPKPDTRQPAYFRPEVTPGQATRFPFQSLADRLSRSQDSPPTADPSGLPVSGRRIEPSPPRRRSRLIPGILIGLLAGFLLFGSAGWYLGQNATTTTPTALPKQATPTRTTALGAFELSQARLNRPYFTGTNLTTISEGWLPYLSTCSRSGRRGGPALNQGERVRVRCTLDGMSAIFVEYRTTADRDRAREKMQSSSVADLAPGMEPAEQRAAPSGRTDGNYVEYAYRLTEDGTTRTVAGVWWEDARTPIAGYLLAFWKEGLGERWEPMRDLWSRYA